MDKITPCFWHDGTAKEAVEFYRSVFKTGKITSENDMVVYFELFGQTFMALNGGSMYSMNPSISIFVECDSEDEIKQIWELLSKDGQIMMPFGTYPWAKQYGWLQDKFGLSWQLSISHQRSPQKLTPLLMFTGSQAGQAKTAMERYTSLFPNSEIHYVFNYNEGEGDNPAFIKHARFSLNGQSFMAMDSSAAHKFGFSEGISLMVECNNQDEVNRFWTDLTKDGEESMCGWLKDTYGVSWQITPRQLLEYMESPDEAVRTYAFQAMLKMRKIEISQLTPM